MPIDDDPYSRWVNEVHVMAALEDGLFVDRLDMLVGIVPVCAAYHEAGHPAEIHESFEQRFPLIVAFALHFETPCPLLVTLYHDLHALLVPLLSLFIDALCLFILSPPSRVHLEDALTASECLLFEVYIEVATACLVILLAPFADSRV